MLVYLSSRMRTPRMLQKAFRFSAKYPSLRHLWSTLHSWVPCTIVVCITTINPRYVLSFLHSDSHKLLLDPGIKRWWSWGKTLAFCPQCAGFEPHIVHWIMKYKRWWPESWFRGYKNGVLDHTACNWGKQLPVWWLIPWAIIPFLYICSHTIDASSGICHRNILCLKFIKFPLLYVRFHGHFILNIHSCSCLGHGWTGSILNYLKYFNLIMRYYMASCFSQRQPCYNWILNDRVIIRLLHQQGHTVEKSSFARRNITTI